ncbi:MAG TPA: bifunctional alpha/beta hydrolase/class I SAM-dependent methyltransferase [Bryobacteraceae bacterium]|jgi:alpha-beta hydrolase superfamily lysophospholipase
MQPTAVALGNPAPRVPEERQFETHDSVPLFYRRWPGSGNRAVVLLHRGHEHSGRLAHLVQELELPEVSFFAWDARAHGRSGGEQVSATTMATFVQDLDEFVRHIRAEFGIAEEEISVVAQSVGAVIAAAWVHDYAPAISCMVLAAPAFKVKLYVPLARVGLGLWHKLAGDFFVKSYVKGRALTHDTQRAASYHTDPLIKPRISARVLLDLYRISDRIVADAAAIRVPTQILLSGSDWVIHNQPPRLFYDRLDTEEKEIHSFQGFFHDTLGEKGRYLAIAKVRAFLERPFTPRPSLQNADGSGFTKREYDHLSQPLSALSPKRWTFGLTKLFLRTLGRLSAGIRLGGDMGFDSGSSLDYVYRNRASGITPLGTLIDWFYLNSPGWRGIRVRKQLLQELIGRAAKRLRLERQPVRIVDVAAGHGRYVLEAIANLDAAPDDVLLRDFDPSNVELGRKLIADQKASARFEQGDAFDRASLASLHPHPTLAIVSGLFELFPQNDPLRETLRGLAAAIESGGYLIYTGQPWHPQLEFIARTLSSHRGGAPWVMRRRTQEELDELVRDGGFRKVEQHIDPEGLFTVTLSERIG